MALPLRAVLRSDQPGGSFALGELIDEYGEEIYLDLKEFWGLDLVSFIAGEVFSSITIIFAMLRNLPEGSRYYAAVTVDREENPPEVTDKPKPDPRMEAIMDHRVWTLDRRLVAMEINAINLNTAISGTWGPDGPPKFEQIGPSAWTEGAIKPAEQEYEDNFDFFRKNGFPLG
ncbi:MAG TPA: hypothetical protein DCR15_14055 [Arthrobacter bacterium]|nr:hypothetical protein [Arthrobacter sp.]